MATKLENLVLERAHFNQFKHRLPRFEECCPKTLDIVMDVWNSQQVSSAFESALANAGGHVVISVDEADLKHIVTGKLSDGKLATVRLNNHGRNYSAPVTNIFNKKGCLRVQVYERLRNKFYYFIFPEDSYKHIPASSNIDIPFNLDGTPKRINRCSTNWWIYQVDDFEEVANLIR
jgi:hypothetical protein